MGAKSKSEQQPAVEQDYPAAAVAAALGGDPQAARDVLQEFVDTVRLARGRAREIPINRSYAEYIANALAKILDSESTDARKALGIKVPKAGRRKGTTTHNHRALAAAVYLLKSRGMTERAAKKALLTEIQLRSGGRLQVPDAKTLSSAVKEFPAFGKPNVWRTLRTTKGVGKGGIEHAVEIDGQGVLEQVLIAESRAFTELIRRILARK